VNSCHRLVPGFLAGLDGIKNKIDPIRLRPHPHEFELYFDA
jgi:hypothetical protein